MPRLLPLFALILAAGGALAEPARMPELGAASRFGQSWDVALLDAAQAAGIDALRDEIHWDAVETGGQLRFRSFLTRYPALLAARRIGLTLIAAGGHPDHDAGVTPFSPEAVAAFAAFAAEAARVFPAITAVEVGNEMNSESFTAGPARDAEITGRAGYYAALLRATHDAVKAVRPDLPIIGGAAHSIPLAWFEALSEGGVADAMDVIGLHPYTTPPEQFRRQVALLRAIPGFEALPIAVTELGTQDADAAPALLMKATCQMALAGVRQIDWYPLGDRGDGYAPLIGPDGSPTATGRMWRLLRDTLAGLDVSDVSPDPFTYGCRFGERALILWGAPRSVTLDDPTMRVIDPAGETPDEPRLDRDAPLMIISEGAAPFLGLNVHLGPQELVADSFDEFAYPGQPNEGFARFGRLGETVLPFALGPGQETGGVPWTPYLRSKRDGALRMDASFLQPAIIDGVPAEIVHVWRAPEAMQVALDAWVAPTEASVDGVTLTIRHEDEVLVSTNVTEPQVIALPALDLAAGDRIEIAVGPGANAEGDASYYRFTLRRLP